MAPVINKLAKVVDQLDEHCEHCRIESHGRWIWLPDHFGYLGCDSILRSSPMSLQLRTACHKVKVPKAIILSDDFRRSLFGIARTRSVIDRAEQLEQASRFTSCGKRPTWAKNSSTPTNHRRLIICSLWPALVTDNAIYRVAHQVVPYV